MKKKIISGKSTSTREFYFYPDKKLITHKHSVFRPVAKDHTIEEIEGYWVIKYIDKK